MRKKNLLALLLAMTMILGILAGCGGGGTEPSASPAPEESTEPSAAPEAENPNAADLVLRGGTIQTMVSEDDTAEALAVKDGEIVYVGDDAGVEEFISDATQIIELEGKYVTPGFIDGHIHGAMPYLTAETELSFAGVEADLETYKQMLTEFVEAHPDYELYKVGSMDLNAFPDSAAENSWLDEICSDKPVICSDVSLHGRLLNTNAIELCGITKDTADPPAGKIYRDANGELTGYFSDCQALLEDLPEFEYTDEQRTDAFLNLQSEANSYGVTSFNLGGEDVMTPELFNKLYEDGKLNLRINYNFFHTDASKEGAQDVIKYIEDNKQYESDFMNVRQVKYKIDGVPEGKSSYLLEPYDPAAEMPADYVGTASCTQEGLNEFTAAVNAAGYTVQTHSMGDASVRMSLEAYEYSMEQNGDMDVRNTIAHVNLIKEEDVPRLAEDKVIAAMQPMWFYYDPLFSPLEEQMFGTERFKSEYHIKDMLEAGVMITGSNDYYVTLDFAPLHGIESGATQCSPYPEQEDEPDKYTRNADQAVSVYEMLKMYTTNAAYGAFLEDRVGTIEVGKKADLVVLGQNLLTCDVKSISDTQVVYTISDGRIVYEG